MGAYVITVIELDFIAFGIHQREIRNTLATIQSIVGEEFTEQELGEHHLLVGKEKALVVRKRNGRWEGIR
ncbi:hypothetical protein [uncultured Sphaerochaeta sp.]|uniref:hypothetical protein n=1 Tax=uncultured Sphaerochaeta sp. TaxID=886478 RepID=UPI002AA8F28D|nr:hypothetical protein [uncultured Sphaerochaeta sp.]